jgi:hypothetical protein
MRCVSLRAYFCVCMSTCMCMGERVDSMGACACARVCVACPPVQTCGCIDACASTHVQMPRCAPPHAHRRLHLRSSAAHTLVHARTDIYVCAYRWLGMDRCASVYMYIYIYITICISLLHIYYVLICFMHIRMYVGTYGHIAHKGVDECVLLRQMPRASMGCTCISRHPFSGIYNVHGHPSIFRCMCFGAASRRACGRVFAVGARGCGRGGCICLTRGLHLPQGTIAAPNAPVCLSRAMRVRV